MEEEVMMGEEVREVVGVAQETSAAEVAAAEGVQENGNFRKDKEQYIMELIKVLTSIGKILDQIDIDNSPDAS